MKEAICNNVYPWYHSENSNMCINKKVCKKYINNIQCLWKIQQNIASLGKCLKIAINNN